MLDCTFKFISPVSSILSTSIISVLSLIPYPIGAFVSVNSIWLPAVTINPGISIFSLSTVTVLFNVEPSGLITFMLYSAPASSLPSLSSFVKSSDKFPTSS